MSYEALGYRLGKGNLQLFPIEVTGDVDNARSTFIPSKNAICKGEEIHLPPIFLDWPTSIVLMETFEQRIM